MKTLLLFGAIALSINVFAQNVNIPDANFKAYLVGNTTINTNSDSEIQVSEANAFTGAIICPQLSITDLTGIEAFTALTELYCNNSDLTSLNISQNIALTNLNCDENQLASLDVSQNTALIELNCRYNPLTSLDVSQNSALTYLNCTENQLTSLDVTQNTALLTLYCNHNYLTSLDVSQNTALINLGCSYNQLTLLDVSQNTVLTLLACFVNQLASLDVAQNTALNLLNCDFNQLTSLDIMQNTALLHLSCVDNQLTCLNAKNGNNTNFTWFKTINNPNLTCIEVDDATWSAANWTLIDAGVNFSGNCNYPANCFSAAVLIHELTTTKKERIKIIDFMGRETEFKPNTPLIFIYSDGTRERVMEIEE